MESIDDALAPIKEALAKAEIAWVTENDPEKAIPTIAKLLYRRIYARLDEEEKRIQRDSNNLQKELERVRELRQTKF